MVGLGGLEPPTSPLSGARSSHLSYRPTRNDRANNDNNSITAIRTQDTVAVVFAPNFGSELVQTVERSDLIGFGECRVVEHRIAEIIDRAAEGQHGLADVHDLRGALA
jgi:hypothetical protein